MLIEKIQQILVNRTLVHIVKMFPFRMKCGGELHSHKSPVPRLVYIVRIPLWVRQNESILMRVLGEPRKGGRLVKPLKRGAEFRCRKVHSGAELMLGIPLFRGK